MAESNTSNEVNAATTVPAPSGLSGNYNSGEINLSWTNNDNSSDGGIDIERSTDNFSTFTTVASNLSPTTTTYADSTTDDGTYQYRVERNTDHATATSGSVSVQTTISVTDSASISASFSTVISSEEIAGDPTFITEGYEDNVLFWGKNWNSVDWAADNTNYGDSITDSNISTLQSEEITLSEASNLTTSATTVGEVSLSWTAGSGEDGYYIYRAESTGSTTSDYTQINSVGSSSTNYIDTTVKDGEKYFYRVSAFNSVTESELSNESTVTSILPAPSVDDTSFNPNGDVLVEWTNNDDSTDGGIDVERGQSGDWPYRKVITIDSAKVDGDLSDWPLTVHLDSDSDLANNAQSNGDDIKFEDANGNQLAHEIESYDSSTGTLWAHVKLPSVSSSSDTTLYIYYGNSSASNQESVADVWSNGYEAVYHLNESASGTGTADVYKDSTANSYDGDDLVSASDKDGQISDGQVFDGNDDVIKTSLPDPSGSFTLELWRKLDTDTTAGLLSTMDSNFDSGFRLIIFNDEYQFELVDGSNSDKIRGGGNNLNTYEYAAARFDGSQVSLLPNASQVASTTANKDQGNQLQIGGYYTDLTVNRFTGGLDEVRVSQVSRSDAWLSTSYTNQNDPLAFYTVGSQQSMITFSDVATGLSPSATSYTDTTVSSGETYEYRIERSTDHATATSGIISIATDLGFTIGGDTVTEMTIDGETVTGLTIDGDTVF